MSQVTELLLRIRQQGDQQLVKLQNTFKTLGQQTAATNVNFRELAQELKKVQAGSAQSINNLKGYANAWREIANSVDTSSEEFRIARQEANALDAQLKTFQGVQTTVASNFRNIATAANQAAVAMRTTNGLIRDPLTGAYRGVAGVTQYGQPIGPAMPPDVSGRIAQQQREAQQQADRDARRRAIMQQRAAYAGEILGVRDPRTGALIAGGAGQFNAVGTQYAQPIGPALPPPRRGPLLPRIARTGGAIAAAGVFGGLEGTIGAGIGAIYGGPLGAAAGGAIGAQVGAIRQAIGSTGQYTAELQKLRIALAGVSKNQADYDRNLQNINQLSKQFLLPLKDTTQQYTKLQASVAGAGMGTAETEKVFKGISAAIIATGGNTEDLNSALRATSQVFSKGKVSAEELRQQIGERMPGAFTIFADAIGKTPQQLDKALENGQVRLEDFIKFSEELFRRYGKTAEIIADAPQNAGARLKMALDNLTVELGRFAGPIGATFQAIATSIVNGLSPAFAAFADLLDLPKAAAKERLPQIERQLQGYEQTVKTYRAGEAMPGGRLAFTIPRQIAEIQLKQLKGEREIIKQTLAATGKGLSSSTRTTADAAAGDQKIKKSKEAVEISKQEAALRVRISLARKQENDLQTAYLTYQLEDLKITEELKARRIGILNAETQRIENKGKLAEAIDQERKNMVGIMLDVVKTKEQEKRALQDIEIQYGLITSKEIGRAHV